MQTQQKNKSIIFILATAAISIAVLGATACSDSTTAALASLYSDSTATVDVATTTGDAMATALEGMQVNDTANAVIGSNEISTAAPNSNATFTRVRTCYDGAGAVVAGCSPYSSVRKIVTKVTMDGSRSGSKSTTGGTSATWSGAVHRVGNDTTLRNFNTATPSVEVSRTHNDLIVGRDTTTFVEGTTSRNAVESFRDTVKGVTWNLPRSSNPFPVSGSIVRVDSVHVAITKANQSETKDRVHIVEIDFPADAQGNVVMKVNAKTCSLNLVTHAVANCH